MITGITINGKHSFRDFGALLASRSFEYPEKERIVESVPYSGVEYDFTSLFGSQILNLRDIKYRFKFVNQNRDINEEDVTRFVEFMYSLVGDVNIYEDDCLKYHWYGTCTSVKNVENTVGYEFGAAKMVEVTFRCDPRRKSNTGDAFVVDATRWPDIDNDNAVTASDATAISVAVANIGAGDPSGLTPEQELKADCDRNGKINASDTQLCLAFCAELGAGNYENTPAGWAKFLNATYGRTPEVI